MYQFCLIVFAVIAVILIILIMLQQNNGNSLGGGFDSNVLGNILNSDGFNNITRFIVALAILFFLFSLLLGNMNSKYNKTNSENNNYSLSKNN